MKTNCNTIRQASQSQKNEKITLVVVIITLVTMFAEIIAGIISGSMALLSDGIHMGTHAVALFITLAAYIFARKHINNSKYSFGTGKVGVLAGYTNAILLLIAGGAMAVESVERMINPVNILFNQAIIVAVIGLIVNIVSAFILGHGGSEQSHGLHEHSHSNPHDHHQDHNLKAAYLHVITDAMTSVLAIFALLTAKYFGFTWADPAVGILGAVVVAKWAVGLLKQTSSVLLDRGDYSVEIESIRSQIESDTTKVQDLHLWKISENERSLILSLESTADKSPGYYHELVKTVGKYEHITVEVNQIMV
jgi:cation diffusion facilitator family transporter